jgi:hypothetical protein
MLADVGRYLPSPADASLAAWARRLHGLLGGRGFGLVVDGYQAHDATLWQRLCEFTAGLYARTGVPGEEARAALFLGNYARTPFGVHRGRSTNFMFVLDGVKRIRAWPDSFFRDKEPPTNSLEYERYNDASVVLEGRPGDVIYWPSSWWHIGEDAGGLSVAVSLMLFMEPVPADVGVVLRHALGGRAGAARRSVGGTLRALASLGRDPALARALTAARLNHRTGFGFAGVPPPARPRHLPDEAVVRGRPEAPVAWRRVDDDLVVSAAGHAFVVPADPRVPPLLRRLNTGRPLRVGDLVAAGTGMVRRGGASYVASPDGVRAVLERLLALGGIVAGR